MARRKAVCIKDIAKSAEVSYAVASLALAGKKHPTIGYSEETRNRIFRVADRLGYRPNRSARNLVNKRHGCIAILTLSVHYFARTTLNAMTQEAMDNDLIVYLDRLAGDGKTMPRTLTEDMADGAILFGEIDEKIERQIERVGIPVVRVNTNQTEGPGVITYNEREGVRLLVAEFAMRGRKRIAFLHGAHSGHYSTKARRDALIEYSREYGLHEPIFFELDSTHYDEHSIEAAVAHPSGADAFVLSDRFLPRLYHFCQQSGKTIGEDVSVLCYEPDWNAKLVTPQCGGIGIGEYWVGQKAVSMLADIIDGNKPSTCVAEYEFKEGMSL